MGCDIHLHIEVKIGEDWHHYGAPSIERRYKLFEKLAGVRGDIENAISTPKGFPEDASVLTKAEYEGWGRDAHTPSWISSDEIMKLEDWLSIQYMPGESPLAHDLEYSILHCHLNGNGFTSFKRYNDVKYLPIGMSDVRFVFWFDN